MAKVFIQESTLTSIGDAIRAKTGKTALIDPINMSAEIASITTGGGSTEFPPEAYIITGDCQNMFYRNRWSWYLDLFGNKLTTKDITNAGSMFSESDSLSTIPMDINLASYAGGSNNAFSFPQVFNGCRNLTTLPRINFPADIEDHTFTDQYGVEFASILSGCANLVDGNNLFDAEKLADYMSRVRMGTEYGFDVQNMLTNCSSLRTVPAWFYAVKLSPESMQPMYWYCSYNSAFWECQCLDEITNLPVRGRADAVWGPDSESYGGGYCENIFQQTFQNCYRLKNLTFETKPDGTPYEANWANQYIDLYSVGVGVHSNVKEFGEWAGISKTDMVYDADSYNALKDSPNWWSEQFRYSRYDHDSAVATINSLPDTSAFLAKVGRTNTIRFRSSSQYATATDGGPITNLTEEEIAVAAAKGWTVSL